ncbi:hypothetical protein DEU56DRAFT_870995 [Suillus clintonianus]|uniref:uncharacterized protein n=1 Tax=Suillus clintonianus TaxID=1904413 RepID=UPI001B874A30|nr:uncharacterized protein DEU56DRAFT_870995 [Suillus clintonianus]KAG2140093.1 hypothetical protein DEU56DRAFT_870995 [Suillus clintonianus]
MRGTAWSKAAGSVPSDRLRSAQRIQHVPQKQSKGKGGAQEPPRSKAIRKLESLAEGVRKSSGREKDPKSGCFCQAREHDLSSYTPICRGCGLILCAVNLPYYACPHCSAVLLSDIARSSLSARLDEEISKQIAKEEDEKSRVVQQARDAEGAFPVLHGSATPPRSSTPSRPAAQTHKVLSLNSKTKKYTVASYTNTPLSSRPASRAESEEEVHRISAPPPEVDFVKRTPDRNHPWNNMRMGDLLYVPVK